ncbi:sphingomyelin phosphodiesterase-like [Bacillus rossius redtenbacheri]|uniref:sphingomyelin phosphodiesterase-like n=1 Tax=Bacillus rossius redtenbacheri TaxID=93214 RepID=UPI002FDD148D
MAQRLCGLLVSQGDCVLRDEWTVGVDLGPKPPPGTPRVQEAETLTVVQLSDIPYEPQYLDGGNAVCGEPVCCLASQGRGANQSLSAGRWGDYRGCDVPLDTQEDALRAVTQRHQKIDYVYMTGDLVDHASWLADKEYNTQIINKVVDSLTKAFGATPIIFTLGNHEAVPVNCYAPWDVSDASLSAQWLFELVSELWSPHLTPAAKQTLLRGGYYTLKLRDGFRVIVLNNIVCYTGNLWLAYESEDPYNQLAWLAETLLQAEKNNEKVHLLYHVSSGYSECLSTWSREFNKIVDRFESTITAHFNGHTHSDEFHVFYSAENASRVNGVALNGGSVTTYSDVNSNYKVYTVDPSSWYILDAESWVFNLTDANLHRNSTPEWYRQYSFREAYGVKSLIPSEVETVVNRMAKDHSLLQKYNSFYYKDGDPSLAAGCDEACLRKKLCDIATTDSSNSTHCRLLEAEFDKASTAPVSQTQT